MVTHEIADGRGDGVAEGETAVALQRLLRWLAVAVVVALAVPLLLSPFSFWDGRIFDHALATGQNAGIRAWFTTSGWHLQYLIFTAVQVTAEATGLSGLTMLRLISVVSVAGIAWEAARFGERVAGLPRVWALGMAVAAAAFPTWNTLLSEVLFMYVLCAWLVLLGVRLVAQGGKAAAAGGLISLLVSLQLNSNFMFGIALVAAYAAFAWRAGQLDRRLLVRLCSIVAMVIGAFLLLRLLYHPSGEYADYNAFTPRLFDPRYLLIEMLRYFEYPILVAVVLLGSFAAVGVMLLLSRTRTSPDLASRRAQPFADLWPLTISIGLMAGAVFPYVAVGKPADLRLPVEWDLRNTIPMAMPLALFLVSLARLLARWVPRRTILTGAAPMLVALIALWAAQQALLWQKLGRSAYEQGLVQALRHRAAPPAGLVFVEAPAMPRPALRYYELNWLLHRAYGREDWLAHQLPLALPSDYPAWMTERTDEFRRGQPVYRSTYMMRSFADRCRSALRVSGLRYSLAQTVGWVFGGSLPDTVVVAEAGRRCAAAVAPPPPPEAEQRAR